MQKRKMPVFSIVFAAICCFYSSGASAAAVTNLTDKTQTIEMKVAGGFTPITIEPGRTWRLAANVVVRVHEHEFQILDIEEYAIWSDGSFGPQRRNSRTTGSI